MSILILPWQSCWKASLLEDVFGPTLGWGETTTFNLSHPPFLKLSNSNENLQANITTVNGSEILVLKLLCKQYYLGELLIFRWQSKNTNNNYENLAPGPKGHSACLIHFQIMNHWPKLLPLNQTKINTCIL